MHCSGFTEFLSTYDLFCISDVQATKGNLLSKAMSCLKGSDQRFLGLLSPTLVVKTESHVEWFDVVTRPFHQHYIMSTTYDHTVSSSITCFISVSFPTIEIKPQLVPNYSASTFLFGLCLENRIKRSHGWMCPTRERTFES